METTSLFDNHWVDSVLKNFIFISFSHNETRCKWIIHNHRNIYNQLSLSRMFRRPWCMFNYLQKYIEKQDLGILHSLQRIGKEKACEQISLSIYIFFPGVNYITKKRRTCLSSFQELVSIKDSCPFQCVVASPGQQLSATRKTKEKKFVELPQKKDDISTGLLTLSPSSSLPSWWDKQTMDDDRW